MKLHSKFDEVVKRKGIKKKFIVDELGISKTTMSLWSNDANGEAKTSPNVFLVLKVAKLLDCKVEDLFEIKEE
ncbi:helix-turn-helix transcriptional regulator [Priestia megaterium]|uniref:helix-turn-helix transcriptional regulator n=1 Tax=Priestia megaterium TaxID=1404 RepID=UPI002E22A9D8|nr:helix-turn-helix transcriptional regulator [Priestia megaterium]